MNNYTYVKISNRKENSIQEIKKEENQKEQATRKNFKKMKETSKETIKTYGEKPAPFLFTFDDIGTVESYFIGSEVYNNNNKKMRNKVILNCF